MSDQTPEILQRLERLEQAIQALLATDKVTVSVCRKEGRAPYGSEGATCEYEFRVPSDLLNHRNDFRAAVDRHYAAADDSVARQLGRHPAPAAQPTPEPVQAGANGHSNGFSGNGKARGQWGAVNGNGNGTAVRNGSRISPPVRSRGDVAPRVNNGLPRNGNQVYPWLKKQANGEELQGYLKDYAAGNGLPSFFKEWTEEETREAIRWLIDQFGDESEGRS